MSHVAWYRIYLTRTSRFAPLTLTQNDPKFLSARNVTVGIVPFPAIAILVGSS